MLNIMAPECQNEILRLMVHSILQTITSCIHENVYYTIMADEVADASNREQFVLCLCWVDKSFDVSEDLIGLYSVYDMMFFNTNISHHGYSYCCV